MCFCAIYTIIKINFALHAYGHCILVSVISPDKTPDTTDNLHLIFSKVNVFHNHEKKLPKQRNSLSCPFSVLCV